MNEPTKSDSERAPRVGERVRLGDRVGVLRYLYRDGAAVVRFDRDTTTRVVSLRRLTACADEPPGPDR